MKITNVKIFKIEKPRSKILGFASFQIQDAITFHGFTIVNGEKGLFVSCPSHKNKDGKYSPYIFFNKKSIKEEINQAILKEWNTLSLSENNKSNLNKSNNNDDDLDDDIPF